MAQQVEQRRQSGGRTIVTVAQWLPWSPNGGTVVATVIAQWTPLVGKRGHNGGKGRAEASLQLIHNVHSSTHFFYGTTNGQPLCIHSATTAMCVPSFCLLWATDLFGDLCATVLNMLKTSRRLWRPWRCLNVLCATLERPRQPCCLLRDFNGDLASFVVAQGRHKGRSPYIGKGVLYGTITFAMITCIPWKTVYLSHFCYGT